MTDRPRLRDWFAPPVLGLHLFAIVAIGFCLFMGMWQLGVYDDRQADQRAENAEVSAVPLESVWSPGETFTTRQDQRHVTVTGTFRPAAEQIWATHQRDDGSDGVWLVSPVTVDGAELMVVRGWAPEALATFPDVPAGSVSFEAVLQPGEESGSGWDATTRTIDGVRIPTLLNELGYEQLWSGFAISTDDSLTAGLARAEVPEPDVSWTAGGRNLGYGLQWWVFAAFALFMWWRMAREIVLGRDR